jgi:uncharacterized protein (DUF58 family)
VLLSGSAERTLRRLDWTVIRRLDGLLQGDYRTVFRGQGLDLADIREYVAGDDVRNIDWNVTARLDVPHVREYLEDREVTAQFLLDVSPSVDFGTANALKRDLLIDLVAVVSRILTRSGNRVGAVVYGSHVERVIPARTGRIQALRIVDELQRRPRLDRAPATSLTELLETALRTFKRRSLIFVVSDFFTTPGWERPLGLLARRHEVIAVRLVDPRERSLPDIGFVILTDAETGEHLFIDTHDRRFRKRFEDAAHRRDDALETTFAHTGVDVLELSTEEDLVRSVIRFATTRKLRAARRRSARVAS